MGTVAEAVLGVSVRPGFTLPTAALPSSRMSPSAERGEVRLALRAARLRRASVVR